MQVVKFPSRPTQWAHLIWVSTGGIVQSLVDSWDDGPCMMECRGYPNSCTKNAFQWTRKHIPPVKKENHRLKSTFWRWYVNFLEGMYFTYWKSSGVFLHTGVQMCFYILNVVCLQNGLTSVVNQIFIGVVSVCSIWFSKQKHMVQTRSPLASEFRAMDDVLSSIFAASTTSFLGSSFSTFVFFLFM